MRCYAAAARRRRARSTAAPTISRRRRTSTLLRPHILPAPQATGSRLLRDLWDLLDSLRMEYWVTGATLLGLCRHGRSPGTLLLRWPSVPWIHLD